MDKLSKVTGVEVDGKHQCQAITKEGTQCTREAVGSEYCQQHQHEYEMEYRLIITARLLSMAYTCMEMSKTLDADIATIKRADEHLAEAMMHLFQAHGILKDG